MLLIYIVVLKLVTIIYDSEVNNMTDTLFQLLQHTSVKLTNIECKIAYYYGKSFLVCFYIIGGYTDIIKNIIILI